MGVLPCKSRQSKTNWQTKSIYVFWSVILFLLKILSRAVKCGEFRLDLGFLTFPASKCLSKISQTWLGRDGSGSSVFTFQSHLYCLHLRPIFPLSISEISNCVWRSGGIWIFHNKYSNSPQFLQLRLVNIKSAPSSLNFNQFIYFRITMSLLPLTDIAEWKDLCVRVRQ